MESGVENRNIAAEANDVDKAMGERAPVHRLENALPPVKTTATSARARQKGDRPYPPLPSHRPLKAPARGARADAKVTAEGASQNPRKNENQCSFHSLPVRALDRKGHVEVKVPSARGLSKCAEQVPNVRRRSPSTSCLGNVAARPETAASRLLSRTRTWPPPGAATHLGEVHLMSLDLP
jgi:hypothetical protein